MSLGNSIRHGAAWLFIGNTGSQILSFLFGIILARLLAPEDFGMLITIQVFTGLAGFVAGGGMAQALVRAKDPSRQDYDIVFTLQLIIGCLIYAIFFFAAPWFAQWYHTPLYADLLRVSALSFILRPFANLPSSILHRQMRFKAKAILSLAGLLLSNAIAISMGVMGYGVWSLTISGLLGAAALAVIQFTLVDWRPGFSLDFRRGRDIARYGLLVSVTDILGYLRNQASTFILSRMLGPASVGLFNKGDSLAKMPNTFITGSVYQVLFRAMAAEQDNLDKCRYLFFRSVALVAVYATPFYIGLLWLADPLIQGIYGNKWEDAAAPLAILALAWPFWLMDYLSGAVLAARNWLDREMTEQASTLVVTALAVLIGIPHGLDGVAWAIVGASVFSGFYKLWLAILCLRARWIDYVRSLIPAAVLNTLLAGILALVSSILPDSVRNNDYGLILVLSASGGLGYALAFLYLPFVSLQTEQQRWKSRLRLLPSFHPGD